MEKYVKKKKLDPLETYVPLVTQARALLEKVDLEDAKGARQLLRSGPFFGIRTCIRSIGQYAAERDGASSSQADQLVTDVFNAFDNFDYHMRSPDEGRVVAREKLNKLILSLDSLLATVPPETMELSQQIIAKAEESGGVDDAEASEDDRMLKSLLK